MNWVFLPSSTPCSVITTHVTLGESLSQLPPQKKTNMSPENQWLEDAFSYWNSLFLRDMFIFGCVSTINGQTVGWWFVVIATWRVACIVSLPSLVKWANGWNIATSATRCPNYSELTRPGPWKEAGRFREMGPLISGKSRLVKYDSVWPDHFG